MPQFFTNENVSLEKVVDAHRQVVVTNEEEIEAKYGIERCVEWIQRNGYKKVCLQFPDYLLPDSSRVALKLQALLEQTVYILGDTSYESCCLDYVAAAHIDADAIVHFGPSCFSKPTGEIPHLFVYEILPIDLDNFKEEFKEKFKGDATVILDSSYGHLKDQLALPQLRILCIDEDLEVPEDSTVIYVGEHGRKLMNLSLIIKTNEFYVYDESKNKTIVKYVPDIRILKRRRFLVEKIKDSRTVGVIVGTLAVKNYLKVIERVKLLLKLNSKKYYLISVGKPTPAKLANFPELDIYVLISCSMNELYDSRDFYVPIVTPHDVEIALNPKAQSNFSFDFNSFLSTNDDLQNLQASDFNSTDVSLLTGTVRGGDFGDGDKESGTVAVKDAGVLVAAGAGFLAQRNWKGLEQNLGGTEVKLAEEGRRGIAKGYVNEADL